MMKLPKTFAEENNIVHVIIETPAGSSNKFSYDPDSGLYRLSRVLPEGLVFPYDMGFIPGTKAEDGDPLDVLVFSEPVLYPGSVISCRLVGIMKAMQDNDGQKPVRNDRLFAVPTDSKRYKQLGTVKDIAPSVLNGLTRFFEFYNAMDGRVFSLLQIEGPVSAVEEVNRRLK